METPTRPQAIGFERGRAPTQGCSTRPTLEPTTNETIRKAQQRAFSYVKYNRTGQWLSVGEILRSENYLNHLTRQLGKKEGEN